MLPGPLSAQVPYVGLSSVGGQAFASEDLFFYGPAVGEEFGYAVATGDFNGDGIDDLATGIPQNRTGAPTAGAVQIHYGRAGGIELAGTHILLQGVAGVPGSPQNNDHFGQALATGDFDDNGHADLVLGAPWHDVAGIGGDVGAEVVFYGSLFADGFEGGSTFAWSAALP
ncbi:MAG: hypothetical protein ABI689_08390 [Thermoanaerobaculia bacterium]